MSVRHSDADALAEQALATPHKKSGWSMSSFYRSFVTSMNDDVEDENEEGVPYGLDIRELIDCRPGMYSSVFADLIGSVKQNIRFFGVWYFTFQCHHRVCVGRSQTTLRVGQTHRHARRGGSNIFGRWPNASPTHIDVVRVPSPKGSG